MKERDVYLAKIVVVCPDCDKTFTVERYVEQFKPITEASCRVRCLHCRTNRRA